jgi:ABC-2 type transport system permease protein
VLGIISYLIIYFLMPASVNETLRIGLYAPANMLAFEEIKKEGLKLEPIDSREALKEMVKEGQYLAGVALPADMKEKFASGERPTITLYFAPDTPEENKEALKTMIKELAYAQQAGQILSVKISEEILGQDMLGTQIPPRDRLRPLFAIFLIMTETLGLASLISEEVEGRTIQALLVTPLRVTGLFVAKGITGVSLAFSQAVLFMAIVGGMNRSPLVVLVALLLGAVMLTGIGFFVASMAKDMMSVMAWGVVALIIMIIPSAAILFPGTIAGWVKAIPSYYLVDIAHRAANFGAGWGSVWLSLLILLGFDLVISWAGVTALKRRFQ